MGVQFPEPLHFNPLPRKEGDKTVHWWLHVFMTDFNPLPRKEGDSKFR